MLAGKGRGRALMRYSPASIEAMPVGPKLRRATVPDMKAHRLVVPLSAAGARLDVFLALALPHLTRSRVQSLVKSGHVRVNGAPPAKAGQSLRGGEHLELEEAAPPPLHAEPQDIALEVIFEDDDLIVIDKPPGLVTHPAPGHADGTLVNALLHHCRTLSAGSAAMRPGIVHRLDKDTSGLLAVAKNDAAHQALAAQFSGRTIDKRYLALVRGWPRRQSGKMEGPIGRHPVDRKKMTVVRLERGRHALTTYRTLAQLEADCVGLSVALLECRLFTGRTHQIRVHLKHLGHPILGDATYGGPSSGVTPPVPRQMLHAWSLALAHPRTGDLLRLIAPIPADFAAYLPRALVLAPGQESV